MGPICHDAAIGASVACRLSPVAIAIRIRNDNVYGMVPPSNNKE